MCKRDVAILVCLALGCLGAAPSRTKTYTTGEVISASDVTENEDNIFSYLQSGVDTYSTGSITATALGTASVETAELADNSVTTSKIVDDTIVNGDISSGAAIAFSKLAAMTSARILVGNSSNVATVVSMSGDVAISNTGATTIQANSVALTTDTTGSYAAGDAEAGNATGLACTNCVAGTEIAVGSDAQGDVLYYDGTDWVRLGAGTLGEFLQTQGAGANPSWEPGGAWRWVETLTLTGTSVTSATLPTDSDVFLAVFDTVRASTDGLGVRFNGDGGANYNHTKLDGGAATWTRTTGQTSARISVDQSNVEGSLQFTRVAAGTGGHAIACNLGVTDGNSMTVRADWTTTDAITTISFVGSGATAMSGQVHLYKLDRQ